uniref:Uncharacterized protein n=2 Tax=Lepeophtheirus salmonis TaxID=72036 RepID=A0A0K2V703_LEPSM
MVSLYLLLVKLNNLQQSHIALKRKKMLLSTFISNGFQQVIKYIYKQRVPANVKDIILDDVDGDGKIELLVVLTDRVIRTYRWEFNTKYNGYKLRGRLHSLNKWDFAGQIGSVALHNIHDSVPTILVTQPGGSCMRIHCAKEERESTEGDLKKILSEDNEPKHSIRNLNVSSEIIGNFGSYYAMATLDGSIIVMDNGKIVKKIKLNHQLFCLNRLSLSPNGLEELIVSSWDGHTYIISQDFRILEFHLGESIAAFKTGHLTLNGRYVPAFAFVTFSDKVYVYHDIDLSKGIGLKSCQDYVPQYQDIKNMLKNTSEIEDLSELFSFLAYGSFNANKL